VTVNLNMSFVFSVTWAGLSQARKGSSAVDILASIGALRPNTAFIDPRLEMEVWPVVADGAHNSNTDLIYWNGAFYLAHQASLAHFGNERSRLFVKKSADARRWEVVAELTVPGEELRDPKFAAIGDRLFLYVLRNRTWNPEPYTTAYTVSPDGSSWAPLVDVQPEGWLFWHPETFDSVTWYAPAYLHLHGEAVLLKTVDGMNWSIVSYIHKRRPRSSRRRSTSCPWPDDSHGPAGGQLA
jgi:hypothetical protein